MRIAETIGSSETCCHNDDNSDGFIFSLVTPGKREKLENKIYSGCCCVSLFCWFRVFIKALHVCSVNKWKQERKHCMICCEAREVLICLKSFYAEIVLEENDFSCKDSPSPKHESYSHIFWGQIQQKYPQNKFVYFTTLRQPPQGSSALSSFPPRHSRKHFLPIERSMFIKNLIFTDTPTHITSYKSKANSTGFLVVLGPRQVTTPAPERHSGAAEVF